MRNRVKVLLFAALIGFVPSISMAQTNATFFKGKQIKFLTMGGPGGGYDTYMRTLIPALEKALSADLVPVNATGAGGLVAMNKVIKARADGLTFALIGSEALVTAQLYKLPGVRYDLQKLEWVARISAEAKVVLLSAKSPFKNLKDMVAANRRITWAGSGRADGNSDFSALLSHVTGMKSKIILGYKGSGSMNLAIQSGEVDGRIVSDAAAALFSKRGPVNVVAILARSRSKKFPNVPTIFEQIKPDAEQAKMLDWRAGVASLGRVIITTPETPPDRVNALRAAFKVAMHDKPTLANLRRRRLEPNFASGAEAKKLVRAALTTLDEKTLVKIREIVLKRYY